MNHGVICEEGDPKENPAEDGTSGRVPEDIQSQLTGMRKRVTWFSARSPFSRRTDNKRKNIR